MKPRTTTEWRQHWTTGAFVYFVRCDRANAVKIGIATDVTKRLAHLQVGCPLDLKLLAAAWSRSPGAEEERLHRLFDRWRIRGEWFTAVPAIRDEAVEMAHAAQRRLQAAVPPYADFRVGGVVIAAAGITWRGPVRRPRPEESDYADPSRI